MKKAKKEGRRFFLKAEAVVYLGAHTKRVLAVEDDYAWEEEEAMIFSCT